MELMNCQHLNFDKRAQFAAMSNNAIYFYFSWTNFFHFSSVDNENKQHFGTRWKIQRAKNEWTKERKTAFVNDKIFVHIFFSCWLSLLASVCFEALNSYIKYRWSAATIQREREREIKVIPFL